ncbi:MAG: OmpH family outer membrane protein [Flavobacteriaceae bacterium]|nr:OmpH family outer membrane protein [Flavobacteriaceae bacterium]
MTSTNFNTKRTHNKVLIILILVCFTSLSSYAQRGVRIGYIDTEYILQNVPEYQQAASQLNKKVQKWKTEIEQRLSVVDQKKKQLTNERVLLTKELIEEREEEIQIEENEILDYKQKRFGPDGDLMTQKKQLMQPVQDQIFAAVQEIATNKKYDFIFDKSADVVMLFSANRFDISDLILRSITRSSKRRQATNRKERKEAKEEDIVPVANNDQDARAQALEAKKASREKAIAERQAKQLAYREAKKKALEEKKRKIIEARKKAREDKLKERENSSDLNTTHEESSEAQTKSKENENTTNTTSDKTEPNKEQPKNVDTKTSTDEAPKPETPKTNKPLSAKEARKKALEEKKRKIIEARKAKLAAKQKQDSIIKAEKLKKIKESQNEKEDKDN